ncbi:MAG: carbamoyltransferase HypF [Candidatus Zixiibacteriota bacterium]|nr:MAG: carbamoyltransferase HypF [candidate division Zixibacteria bacterium]
MPDKSHLKSKPEARLTRKRIRINGIVQGVGFRPFVYRLATEAGLGGFVNNDAEGVLIEVEGASESLDGFCGRLRSEAPPLAKIVELTDEEMKGRGDQTFTIQVSTYDKLPSTLISPDIAVCDDCLSELFNPNDRRYRYPFINCTNCGPRYTIVEGIPYDRPLTSMKVFPMCPDCEREYHDPSDRRFHAQPNACPECGPALTLRDSTGVGIETADPIAEAVKLLRDGKVVAVRGVGGYHLAVDAHNTEAIGELRLRKGRAQKPFALMAPDLESIRKYCHVDSEHEVLLKHYTRPIVLLRKRHDCQLPESIASRNRYLGFMLPYSPHHHLLIRGNFDALIMTSGNYSEEPIAIGNEEAFERLKSMADYLLTHNREILQRCDDSIAIISAGGIQAIRRSRGYVPQPIFLKESTRRRLLAVGGELKNTIALSRGNQVFLSQHVGDLDNPSAYEFFQNSIEHLGRILEIAPEAIVCDMHPEYLSTKWATGQQLQTVAVQHHHAHLVSVMADNSISEPAIGIILDGTGYGTDGTIWGGEVIIGDAGSFERFAWLEPVAMPGGAAAIKEPWRMAISYLYHTFGPEITKLDLPFLKNIGAKDIELLIQMIDKEINSPMTSSCGRLFDGVSAILGIRSEINFEAQAAVELEMTASEAYITPGQASNASAERAIDVTNIIRAMLDGIARGTPVEELASLFHTTLAETFVVSAKRAREKSGINRVGLSGGVYQNRYFTSYIVERFKEEGFEVLQHRQVPPNDGGLALGQIVAGDAKLRASGTS